MENGVEVSFAPVTNGSPENDKFFQYTPWGSLNIGLVSRAAAGQIVVGDEYYLDISVAQDNLSLAV
jgi:hypothetical protein